ncbi:MAG TPA: hypothetical protein VFP54_11890 [Acidimicrobiales bacterium]|nr:hypothetical protein [Acidimicrobiales bacterium]
MTRRIDGCETEEGQGADFTTPPGTTTSRAATWAPRARADAAGGAGRRVET